MSTLRRPISLLLISIFSLALSLLTACGANNQKACANSDCCGNVPSSDACPATIFLVADGLNGQISVFPALGALGTPVTVSGPPQSLGMVSFENQFLYAANPVPLSGSVIDAWSMNSSTGQLTPLSGSPFAIGPSSVAGGLAMNVDASVLYVADAGKIDALQVNPVGALATLPGSPFPAGTGLAVTIDSGDRFVYSTDSTPPGNVYAFTANSTGALTPVAGSPYAVGTNPSTSSAPSQIVVDLTGKFVFVTLAAANQVAAFSIDQSTGALTAVPGSPFATGNGPVAIATAINFLYVSNTTDGTVSGYTFDTTTGVLTPAPGSPFPISAGALATNPGSALYASTPQGIVEYSIDPSTGALTEMGQPVSSPGASVLTFVF